MTLSGLTVVIPSSFTDDAGDGIVVGHATLNDMDIESLNPGSDGVPNIQKGATFSNVSMYGSGTGSFDIGISQTSLAYNPLAIDRSTIEDAKTGILATHFTDKVNVNRSRILNSKTNAVKLTQGADGTIENSIIQAGSSSAVFLSNKESTNSDVDIRYSTIIPGASSAYAVATETVPTAMTVGSSRMTVSDSILNGFTNTYYRSDPDSPTTGAANITFSHSDFDPTGLSTGKGVLDTTDSNINADPKFLSATDFHLTKGSPAIDTASSPAGPLVDIDGNKRPVDGNGDGIAVADMGAYEYQPVADPPTCETDPKLCPVLPGDTTAPVISKVKFKSPKGKKAGKLKLRLSEAATIKATFKPTPKGKGKKKRKTLKLSKTGKAGANKLKIKKGKLKPGKYRLKIIATDAAGNRSKPMVRKVKVK
ncbi:MAG: right-handed parallel beta-helix repeat-containing protein [Solirubrobacterales bacterium]|nr:right-handed parallel beta-helix repeat-containing protein [Solirubrobacterales bacterium]